MAAFGFRKTRVSVGRQREVAASVVQLRCEYSAREDWAHMVRHWRRFWDDEAGAELVEWAVVAVIVLLTTVGVVYLISQEGLPHYFDAIMERLGFYQVGS